MWYIILHNSFFDIFHISLAFMFVSLFNKKKRFIPVNFDGSLAYIVIHHPIYAILTGGLFRSDFRKNFCNHQTFCNENVANSTPQTNAFQPSYAGCISREVMQDGITGGCKLQFKLLWQWEECVHCRQFCVASVMRCSHLTAWRRPTWLLLRIITAFLMFSSCLSFIRTIFLQVCLLTSPKVIIKMAVFWDVTACILVDVSEVTISPDNGGSKHLWNVGQFLWKLHDSIFQKTVILLTAVRSWNLVCIDTVAYPVHQERQHTMFETNFHLMRLSDFIYWNKNNFGALFKLLLLVVHTLFPVMTWFYHHLRLIFYFLFHPHLRLPADTGFRRRDIASHITLRESKLNLTLPKRRLYRRRTLYTFH
jgi:hypothetical protein